MKYFQFIGRVLAKALIDKQTLRCRLAKHLYKLVLGWPINLDDLIDVDLEYHNFLLSLEAMGVGEMDNLGLHFTASEDCLGTKTRVPLVPNGFDIEVNDTNFPEYIVACFKYHMFDRCKDQLSELLLGFFEVVPEPMLAIFDFQELEELMCGSYVGGKPEEGDIRGGRLEVEEQSYENLNSSTAPTSNATQTHTEEAEVVPDAIVTPAWRHAASSISSGPLPVVPQATLFDDEVYEAVKVDDSTKLGNEVDSKERNHRIKLGQCPSCGIQTHEVSGIINKKHHPLSNEHVLAGRCLLCNPTNSSSPQMIQFSSSATNAQVNNEIQSNNKNEDNDDSVVESPSNMIEYTQQPERRGSQTNFTKMVWNEFQREQYLPMILMPVVSNASFVPLTCLFQCRQNLLSVQYVVPSLILMKVMR